MYANDNKGFLPAFAITTTPPDANWDQTVHHWTASLAPYVGISDFLCTDDQRNEKAVYQCTNARKADVTNYDWKSYPSTYAINVLASSAYPATAACMVENKRESYRYLQSSRVPGSEFPLFADLDVSTNFGAYFSRSDRTNPAPAPDDYMVGFRHSAGNKVNDHKAGKVNVSFADGHGETLSYEEFKAVNPSQGVIRALNLGTY